MLGRSTEFYGYERLEADSVKEGRIVTYTEDGAGYKSEWNLTKIKVTRFGVTGNVKFVNSTSQEDLSAFGMVMARAYREYEVLDRLRGKVEGLIEDEFITLPTVRTRE